MAQGGLSITVKFPLPLHLLQSSSMTSNITNWAREDIFSSIVNVVVHR